MDGFTAEELRQAADRVREMQRRAKMSASSGNETKPQQTQISAPQSPQIVAPKKKSILELINFKNMEIDADRSLLLGILLLLTSDATDEILMFALIYIMM